MRAYLDSLGVLPASEYDARVLAIPLGVLHDWELERSGPWEYFHDVDLTGAHIALDEAHNVVGVHHSKAHKQAWSSWLGEIRQPWCNDRIPLPGPGQARR